MENAGGLVSRQVFLIAFASSTLALLFASYWWWKNVYRMTGRRRSRKPNSVTPCEWRLSGYLTGVKLYPLKSGRGIDLNEAEATPLGLKSGLLRDRFFIIYDEKGNFVTGRKHPKSVLITVSVSDTSSYCFTAPGSTPLIIQLPEDSKEKAQRKFLCRLWSDKVCGLDTGDDAAKWISQVLLNENEGLRVGFYDPEFGVERSVTPLNRFYKSLMPADTGAFSDLSAFLLISEDSVADLNSRLGQDDQVTSANFRPNLVVKFIEEGKPFEEDDWEWIRIGDEDGPVFRNVKPCTRCVFTTVDPQKGVLNQHKEPLSTLKGYRKLVDPEALRLEGTAPVMGINLGLYLEGMVHVGDPVYTGKQLLKT